VPTLTRWFIKSSLIYLVTALFLGLILALPESVALPSFVRFMNPPYFHLFLVGWVTQMIFGVIYWMFPIITRERPRGNERLGWSCYILLNAGLLLRVIGEPLVGVRQLPAGVSVGTGFGWLLVASALLQWLATVIFVYLAWPRVKEKYRGG
jgi:hypothetical protein